jgi:hypothetical protein
MHAFASTARLIATRALAASARAYIYIYIKIAEIIDDLTCKLNQSINLHVAS